MTFSSVATVVAAVLAIAIAASPQVAAPQGRSVNQNSLSIKDFDKRLDDYAKMRRRAQAGLSDPKSGSPIANIKLYQQAFAQNIRSERPQARAGDIFTPPIGQLFRELIAASIGASGGKIQASLRHAEPVRGLPLDVNQEYPQTSAMQSTPPTLLSNLPRLPAELEYRIVGRELVLLDTKANLIVDLLPDALPGSHSDVETNEK